MLIIIQSNYWAKHSMVRMNRGKLLKEKKEEGILGNIGHYVIFTYNPSASKRWTS